MTKTPRNRDTPRGFSVLYFSVSFSIAVLVLPCGRSAHTEAGWFAGQGKKVVAYIPTKQEPELMYKLFSAVACSIEEVMDALAEQADYVPLSLQ